MQLKIRFKFYIWFMTAAIPLAQAYAAGTSALQFLTLRAASRSESLGGALTAGGGDISSLSVNPATLSRLLYSEALFSQALLFEDMKFSYMAYAQPTKHGVPSFEYMNLSYGSFDNIDRGGNSIGSQSPKDSLIGFGWSTVRYKKSSSGAMSDSREGIFKNLDAGASVRYFKSDLGAASASGLSVNLGALYKTPLVGLNLGVAVNNLGSPVKYADQSVPQPRTVRLGLGYSTNEFLAFSAKARFTLDVSAPKDGKMYVSMGKEFIFANMLSLQAGYAGEEAIDQRFRFGFGVGLDAINLNYSASPMGSLGTSHRISVRMRFGTGVWNLMSILSGEQGMRENLRIANEYKDAGNHQKAVFYAHRVLKNHPDDPEAKEIIRGIEVSERAKMGAQIYGEAVAMIRLGLMNDAQEKLRQTIELDPENKNYQNVYASIKIQVERDQLSETQKLLAKIKESQNLKPVDQPALPPQQVASLPLPEPSVISDSNASVIPAANSSQADTTLPKHKKRRQDPKPEETAQAPEALNQELDAASKADYQTVLARIQERNLDEAITLLRGITDRNKLNQETSLKLSECLKGRGVKLFAKGRYEESFNDFKEAQGINPKDPSLKKFIANVQQIMDALNLQPTVASYLKSRK